MLNSMQVDVSNEYQTKALVAETVRWAGRIDFYINNAAKFAFGNVRTVSDAGVNPWHCAAAFVCAAASVGKATITLRDHQKCDA